MCACVFNGHVVHIEMQFMSSGVVPLDVVVYTFTLMEKQKLNRVYRYFIITFVSLFRYFVLLIYPMW